jgi:hypothetical protein
MTPQEILLKKLQEAGSKRLMRKSPENMLASKAVNGVGAFVPSLCKLQYLRLTQRLSVNTPRPGAGGDSKGMQDWIRANANRFAQQRPYVHINIAHQSGPPMIRAEFNNGTTLTENVARWPLDKIQKLVDRMCDARGRDNYARKVNKPVLRGTGSDMDKFMPWDPFHNPIFRP